jgi:cell division protein ZapA
MGQITVGINGRQYRMACEDGEEDHLTRLAAQFNQQIEKLRGSFGEIGDSRLLVMAALTISDALADAKDRMARLEQEVGGLQEARVVAAGRAQATQAATLAALNAAAERIERVTRSLNQSLGEPVAIG